MLGIFFFSFVFFPSFSFLKSPGKHINNSEHMLYVNCFKYFNSIKRAEANPIQTSKGRNMHCKRMAGVMQIYF